MTRDNARARARAGKARGAPPAPPPVALGFRMPAEWEPHAATWLAWPHERSDWPGPGKLEAVRWVYVEFIRHVVAEASRDKEETLIVTIDRKHQETVRRNWPFLRDRRIDAYGAITRRFLDE